MGSTTLGSIAIGGRLAMAGTVAGTLRGIALGMVPGMIHGSTHGTMAMAGVGTDGIHLGIMAMAGAIPTGVAGMAVVMPVIIEEATRVAWPATAPGVTAVQPLAAMETLDGHTAILAIMAELAAIHPEVAAIARLVRAVVHPILHPLTTTLVSATAHAHL